MSDLSSTGKERPWRKHKLNAKYLAGIYEELGNPKAERVRYCASYLAFDRESRKLKEAQFCRVRLCPMCMWRRSLKVFYQCAKIVDHLRSKRYVYVLLTLTVRNCLPAALSRTLDDMSRAWHAMIKTDEFTGAVAGYYKTVEIKHRVRDYKTGEWLEQDDYHPHIHVLLACKKGYSESSSMYVTQKRWREIWARTLKIDYDPRVDVRYVKGRTGKIIAEVCKYGCKAEEYIMPDHWELSCSTVALLDDVLHKRRFADFGGEFKKAYRELGLAKNENDLINVDPDAPSIKPSYMLDIYRWAGGYAQYVLSEE